MGGSRSIREVSLVCARRKTPAPTQGEPVPGSIRGARRLGEGDGGNREKGGTLRGVAGFAAYRAFLGEVAIGPWRQETPSTFGRIEGLRADEVSCFSDGGRVGGDGGDGVVVVDLSLAWETEGCVRKGDRDYRARTTSGAFGAGSPWATLHCDLWRAVGTEGAEGGISWRWLGRAYGQKYRLTGLRVSSGGGEAGLGGEGRAEVADGTLVLAVQQVNAMGYRQVRYFCARTR